MEQMFAAPVFCYSNTDGGKGLLISSKIMFEYTQVRWLMNSDVGIVSPCIAI